MLMAEYKIKYSDNLYYSDTDSLFLSCPLPQEKVGDKLGEFKLEYKIKEGVFIAPKVYGLILEDDNKIVKIKGSKNKNVTLDQLKGLLFKDSELKLNQEKWFRSLSSSSINIIESIYTLNTDNKREFVYKGGEIIDTKPIELSA